MSDSDTSVQAPGWDAIDAALASRYGSVEPLHYGTIIKYRLGGPDPLDGISVYVNDGKEPHLHFVSYGLTELYAKEGDSADCSGYGFELTFRLAREAEDRKPPNWAVNMMQNVARYVFKTGNTFEPGHYVDLNGPIALDRATDIRAIAFADDPELPPQSTPNGRMRFLQIVGLTLDELAAARRWNTDGVLELLRQRTPLLVTNLARVSMMRSPEVVAEVEARVAKEGSSSAALFVTELTSRAAGGVLTINLGARAVREIVDLLPARLRFERALLIESKRETVAFEPGDAFSFRHEEGVLVVVLPPNAVSELARGLEPKQGRYVVPSAPGLEIVVSPSIIRDGDGNVVETIGE
jgi:hypothetical protein